MIIECTAPVSKPTSEGPAGHVSSRVLEVKRNWLKEDERWQCDLLFLSECGAALRYVLERLWPIVDSAPPAGAVTLAHYWTDRD